MFDVQMAAVTGVDAERNKRRSRQMFLNLFWVHAPNLLITRRNLNVHHAGGTSPKCAACDAYAARSSSIASMVAAIGSSLAKPEKIARSPISLSTTKVGRCVTWSA